MELKLKNILWVIGLSGVSSIATAATTITFDGEVSSQTCSLSINGGGSSYVMLAPVNKNALSSVGATSGETTFTISATGCAALTAPKTTQDVKVKFLGHNVSTSGVLNNSYTGTNAATGVGFQLKDNSTAIDLSTGPTSIAIGQLTSSSNTSTTLSKDFKVAYYATTTSVTEGKVQGILEYTVSYF